MSEPTTSWLWSIPAAILVPVLGVLSWLIKKIVYSVDEERVRQIVEDKIATINEQTRALTNRLENIEDKVDRTYDRVDNIYAIIVENKKK